MQSLNQIDDITALYEIFHKNSEVAQSSMKTIWPLIQATLSSKYYTNDIQKLKDNPARIIKEALNAIETSHLAYKVFPGHLKNPVLGHLISHTTPIFLSRNILDAWISQCFAENVKEWANKSTTNKKLVFYPKHFVLKARYNARFIATCLSFCHAHKKAWLWYDYSAYQNTEIFVKQLSSDLSLLFKRPFSVSTSSPQLVKQDTRSQALHKVSNPEEMEKWLEENNLSILLSNKHPLNYSELAGRLEIIANENGWDTNKTVETPTIIST